MARLFDGTSDYIAVTGAEGSALDFNGTPFAFSLWANFAAITVRDTIFGKGYDGSITAYQLKITDADSSKIEFGTFTGSTHGVSNITHGFSTGVWNHIYGDFDGAAWHLYLNNSGNTSVDSTGPANNAMPLELGSLPRVPGTHSDFANVNLAEVAFWSNALSVGEINALFKGYAPSHMRRGLIFYAPLLRDLVSPVGGFALSASGTTVTPHPRVIMPRGARTHYRLALYIRPDADSADGGWTNESGNNTNLFASIDETAASDSDYIQSALTPVNDIVTVRLSDPSAGVGQPVNVSYRYQKVGSDTIDLIVRLKQGATTKATWTHSNISTSYVDARQTLSGGEFASITDWTDLFLEFEADVP